MQAETPEASPPDEAKLAPGRRGGLRAALVALVGYVALEAMLFHPLLLRLGSHILADDLLSRPGTSDAFNFHWSSWWIHRAVVRGEDPFACAWVLPPHGADLRFHTHVLLPTVLSLPARALLGATGGYNVMVLAMLLGGAWVHGLFVRHTLELPWKWAFPAGAAFGFLPYFVFKVHAHPNLAGAFAWGSALAVLVHALYRATPGLRHGVFFALAFWATFWTSLLEAFMTALVVLLVLVLARLPGLSPPRPVPWRALARLLLPVVPGALSLLAFRGTAPGATVSIRAFPDYGLGALFTAFPRLSVLGGLSMAGGPEYAGSYVPWSVTLLGLAGAYATLRGGCAQRRLGALLAVAAVVLLLVAGDPWGLSTRALRALPLGTGFRVAGRFLPFALFFACALAALGLRALWVGLARGARGAVLALLALVAAVEYVPYGLHPSPVRALAIPESVRARLRSGGFTLVLPRGRYRNVDDTWQPALDAPCVHLSYLAREGPGRRASRQRRFPRVYLSGSRVRDARWRSELRELDVRFVLFEDGAEHGPSGLGGRVLHDGPAARLVELAR